MGQHESSRGKASQQRQDIMVGHGQVSLDKGTM
jgi:hypothetical protein